jgi:hypothetical protein
MAIVSSMSLFTHFHRAPRKAPSGLPLGLPGCGVGQAMMAMNPCGDAGKVVGKSRVVTRDIAIDTPQGSTR